MSVVDRIIGRGRKDALAKAVIGRVDSLIKKSVAIKPSTAFGNLIIEGRSPDSGHKLVYNKIETPNDTTIYDLFSSDSMHEGQHLRVVVSTGQPPFLAIADKYNKKPHSFRILTPRKDRTLRRRMGIPQS